jgi:hypothetical protein
VKFSLPAFELRVRKLAANGGNNIAESLFDVRESDFLNSMNVSREIRL